MTEHEVTKALEVWTLQALLNISILLGVLALGLALVQGYYRSLEKHLTLRVSIELWRVATVAFADVVLVAIVLVGVARAEPRHHGRHQGRPSVLPGCHDFVRRSPCPAIVPRRP